MTKITATQTTPLEIESLRVIDQSSPERDELRRV